MESFLTIAFILSVVFISDAADSILIGFFSTLGIFFVLSIIVSMIKENNSGNSSFVSRGGNFLDIKTSVKNNTVENIPLSVLLIEIKGELKLPYNNYNITYESRIYDVTDGDEKEVLSFVEELQEPFSNTFLLIRESVIPYANCEISDWMCVGLAPIELLQFPRKGERTAKVELKIVGNNGDTIITLFDTIQIDVQADGYLDNIEKNIKFEETVIKTAMYIAHADCNITSSELDIIKEWIKKRSNNRSQSDKERLNEFFVNVHAQAISKNINLREVLKNIDDFASEGQKYEILELCIKICSNDKFFDDREIKEIDYLAKILNLNEKKYKEILQKGISGVKMSSRASNHEILLGITPGMSNDEINTILRKEYAKWNARFSNQDEKIRKQAEEMLKIISELRLKYKK